MFIEKFKSIDLIHRQKNEFFLYHWQFNKFFISQQTRITFYFLFVTFKKNNKLVSNKQSNFVARKIIDVEKFDLKRVFLSFKLFFEYIDHVITSYKFFIVKTFCKNIVFMSIKVQNIWDNCETTRTSFFFEKIWANCYELIENKK